MEQTIVLPGDQISSESPLSALGPGLRGSTDDEPIILAINCGILRQRTDEDEAKKESVSAWVDCDNRRYIPVNGDNVIGQVVQRIGAEGWKLEIGCSELANLSNLSFEGATKRNRPNVKIGDIIYGRIVETVEPEIVCVSEDRRARSFGVLPSSGGWLIRSAPGHVRKLLSSQCRLFHLLGEKVPFELTCGMNGWIWIKAHNVREIIFLTKAVEMSRFLSNDQMRELVVKLEKKHLKSF